MKHETELWAKYWAVSVSFADRLFPVFPSSYQRDLQSSKNLWLKQLGKQRTEREKVYGGERKGDSNPLAIDLPKINTDHALKLKVETQTFATKEGIGCSRYASVESYKNI